MNIKEAAQQIEYAVKAYLEKDEFGEYAVPVYRQRPVILMGPPGIGKTAIMEQIASRLGIGLVSYSMTHHTRQSALGLPFITKKNYGGKEYSVSEYTMSEIIASVYDMMEEGNVKEGILFLDEINCVSETLAPAMLQFLQYKTFGRHKVPDGWIVVTAGNPPEYNNSVRDFDIVTWDRLKRIDIEPDFEVWKEYAASQRVHPAILTYLEIKRDDFYKVETTVSGKTFVTARGWTDLPQMIRLYEKNNFPVDEALTAQYLQNSAVSRDFSVYYDLFNKYRSDYQVQYILEGRASEDILERAKAAGFDERLSLIGLILDSLRGDFAGVSSKEDILRLVLSKLKPLKETAGALSAKQVHEETVNTVHEITSLSEAAKLSQSRTGQEICAMKAAASIFEKMSFELLSSKPETGEEAFALIKTIYDAEKNSLKALAAKASAHLKNSFDFLSQAFGAGNEMLIFITELTADKNSAAFISRYGSEEYFRYNKELMVYERRQEIVREIEELGL